MNTLKVNLEHFSQFATGEELSRLQGECAKSLSQLEQGTGEGNNMLGWLDLPSRQPEELINDVKDAAASLSKQIDILVVIGIGGSYLGARAIISALAHQFETLLSGTRNPLVLFAGHNMGEDYLHELMEVLSENDYGILVISKSGTTTEPAVAFRMLKNHCEEKYGKKNAAGRIIAVTDKQKGALRTLATQSGYRSFIIPDDTGGRFSGLTPVGLLPVAIAGYDIDELLNGARAMEKLTHSSVPLEKNPSAMYAIARHALYRKGKKIEVLSNFDNRLIYFSEWWKQLFGESEGKSLKGIFPASVTYTTDLHSMGQYLQDGERILFETLIRVASQKNTVIIPSDKSNLDDLNFLAGKSVNEVNKMAELGTILAHVDGGVPNIIIEVPEINEFHLGGLIYFFEKACGISGYMLGVNPFNQPGVEAYKKNMFALFGKPGYEEEAEKLKNRIG
jgi:glucose-6-phosphate isomerase